MAYSAGVWTRLSSSMSAERAGICASFSGIGAPGVDSPTVTGGSSGIFSTLCWVQPDNNSNRQSSSHLFFIMQSTSCLQHCFFYYCT